MFEEIVGALPYLFSLFVPGFLFLKIYYRFKYSAPEKSLDHTIFYSVIISYILSVTIEFVFEILKIEKSETFQTIITIIFGVVMGFVSVSIIHSNWFEYFLEKTTNTSVEDNIWSIIFNPNNDTLVRIPTSYRGEEVIIEGILKMHDVKNDFCDMVITDYKIIYENGKVLSKKDNPDCMHEYLYFNSQNVHFIEVSNVALEKEKIKLEANFNHYKK